MYFLCISSNFWQQIQNHFFKKKNTLKKCFCPKCFFLRFGPQIQMYVSVKNINCCVIGHNKKSTHINSIGAVELMFSSLALDGSVFSAYTSIEKFNLIYNPAVYTCSEKKPLFEKKIDIIKLTKN